MPTQPFKKLLSRDLALANAKPLIDLVCPTLIEAINYSTQALQRCQTSKVARLGEPDEHFPLLSLFLQTIEFADGIQVQLDMSCVTSSIPLLRSMFEADLAVNYLLEKDYQDRAYSWVVAYIHRKLAWHDRFDVNTSRGKQFQTALNDDVTSKYFNVPPIPKSFINEGQNLRNLLNSEPYATINKEYLLLKDKFHREPNWYSLFSGPSSEHDLALKLNKGGQYEILYRYWSETAHANVGRLLGGSKNGQAMISSLRSANEFVAVGNMAISLLLDVINKTEQKLSPGDTVNRVSWFTTEVQPARKRIRNTKIVINEAEI